MSLTGTKMKQINYLQVGPDVHCLRCHEWVPRDDLFKHVDVECPNKDKEAKLDKENCESCKGFNLLGYEN